MICELTNKMINAVEYTFNGKTDTSMLKDSYGIMDVIIWTMMFVIVFVFLSWWIVPLRKLGVLSIRFHCNKDK